MEDRHVCIHSLTPRHAMAHTWKSEDNFQKSVPPSMWVPGIELKFGPRHSRFTRLPARGLCLRSQPPLLQGCIVWLSDGVLTDLRKKESVTPGLQLQSVLSDWKQHELSEQDCLEERKGKGQGTVCLWTKMWELSRRVMTRFKLLAFPWCNLVLPCFLP